MSFNSSNFKQSAIDHSVNVRAITVEEALNKAGGFGRFQCIYLVLLVMAMNSAGLVVYGISYYEKAPPYICVYNAPQDPPPGDFIA